eukprot:10966957-Alexandrium_andersonii.AAC.1
MRPRQQASRFARTAAHKRSNTRIDDASSTTRASARPRKCSKKTLRYPLRVRSHKDMCEFRLAVAQWAQ